MSRIRVILTDLNCVIEGESAIFGAGVEGGTLERKGLGFWMKNWNEYRDAVESKTGNLHHRKAVHHNSEVFVPWSSTLYVERLQDGSGD